MVRSDIKIEPGITKLFYKDDAVLEEQIYHESGNVYGCKY